MVLYRTYNYLALALFQSNLNSFSQMYIIMNIWAERPIYYIVRDDFFYLVFRVYWSQVAQIFKKV